jgi:hypothetical protein
VLLFIVALPFGTTNATSLAKSMMAAGAVNGPVEQVQWRRRRRRRVHIVWRSLGWGHFRGWSRRRRHRRRRSTWW